MIESFCDTLKNLKTLNLSKNNLSTLTAGQLALSFEDKNTISHLILHDNNLNGNDMINFINIINKHDFIEHLDISWN